MTYVELITNAAPRSVTVQQGPLPPAFTTADAQALDVQAVLGTATIAIPEATDRTADTQHVTSLVMGTVVQPGAVWSFNKVVGAPTKTNGFAEPSSASDNGVDASLHPQVEFGKIRRTAEIPLPIAIADHRCRRAM